MRRKATHLHHYEQPQSCNRWPLSAAPPAPDAGAREVPSPHPHSAQQEQHLAAAVLGSTADFPLAFSGGGEAGASMVERRRLGFESPPESPERSDAGGLFLVKTLVFISEILNPFDIFRPNNVIIKPVQYSTRTYHTC